MNIEIANRLVNLRKENSLSQEALAEKLGISRQAVSKWERAEASPDTDNLILLARLYGVSLDELLKTEDEIPEAEEEMRRGREENGPATDAAAPEAGAQRTDGAEAGDGSCKSGADGWEYDWDGCGNDGEEDGGAEGGHTWRDGNGTVHIGRDGIHVKEKNGGDEVHVSWKGIHVKENKRGEEVHVGWNGIHVRDSEEGDIDVDGSGVYRNGEKWDDYPHYHSFWKEPEFPFSILVVAAYLLLGIFWGYWGYGLLLFLTIPLWHSTLSAWRHRDPGRFAFPVLLLGVWLCMGLFWKLWHPGWAVFLLIPIYYELIHYFRAKRKRKREKAKETEEGSGIF